MSRTLNHTGASMSVCLLQFLKSCSPLPPPSLADSLEFWKGLYLLRWPPTILAFNRLLNHFLWCCVHCASMVTHHFLWRRSLNILLPMCLPLRNTLCFWCPMLKEWMYEQMLSPSYRVSLLSFVCTINAWPMIASQYLFGETRKAKKRERDKRKLKNERKGIIERKHKFGFCICNQSSSCKKGKNRRWPKGRKSTPLWIYMIEVRVAKGAKKRYYES